MNNSLPSISANPPLPKCYLCDDHIEESAPQFFHPELGKRAARLDAFHNNCSIRASVLSASCPICVRWSCPIWDKEISIYKTAPILQKIWKGWFLVQYFYKFMLSSKMASCLILARIACYLSPEKRVWILPFLIVVDTIEFTARFLILSAMTSLALKALGWSSSWILVSLVNVIIARFIAFFISKFLSCIHLSVPLEHNKRTVQEEIQNAAPSEEPHAHPA